MLRWVVIHKVNLRMYSQDLLSTKSPQVWNSSPLEFHTDLPSVLQDRSTLTATELREKLLREKVKALRKSSITQKELDIDGG